MRIIQINCVYAKGSTGRIVETLHRYYQTHGHESYVLYGRGESPDVQKNIIKVSRELPSKARSALSRITGNLYGMALMPTRRIKKSIETIAPDVVHLHCINGNFCNIFQLISWLGAEGIPTVITQHAEFLYTGNCGYAYDCEQWKTGCHHCPDPVGAIGSPRHAATHENWLKMKNAFEGAAQFRLVGVSDWVSERSRQSAILGAYPCLTVLNGLDTSVFHFRGKDKKACSEVIYVTPYFEDENKGGLWLLELAKETHNQPIHYSVVGRTEKEYAADNVTFEGVVNDPARLAKLYSNADVCLLTSRRETFSMVTAEALCCGTPVVGFRAGAPEQICIPEYGSFVPYGDIHALKTALVDMLKREVDRQRLSDTAKSKYSSERMAKEYIGIYEAFA